MKNVVVVGSQWGDEGKGKIVDWLSSEADVVVRFQGGHNAGHTLVIDKKVFKLRLLPSGIVRKGKISILGNGVVIDPWALLNEIQEIKNNVINISENSNKQISTLSIAKKNISNLIKSFDNLKDLRKRLIFKIRSKRGLDTSSVEYNEFMKIVRGGGCMEDGDRGWFQKESESTCGTGFSGNENQYQSFLESSENPKYLNNNIFYQMYKLTTIMDEVLSSKAIFSETKNDFSIVYVSESSGTALNSTVYLSEIIYDYEDFFNQLEELILEVEMSAMAIDLLPDTGSVAT